ncbi:MAG: hypothetical protein WBQ38_14345 [Ignavibacteria bacterium]|nr:hypothetical protein [Ignavibacteria bacterium]MBK7446071.1 hypothetical protein [Ignavibacteria bacterium]MBK8381347.1 hypothetical protein [Ignavibacteria bacterium]MBK9404515.1 hypothetical protein [Ignavibacteria bacterium]MBL0108684.1 hypothetical protein [Ignavibacteria bacterium]
MFKAKLIILTITVTFLMTFCNSNSEGKAIEVLNEFTINQNVKDIEPKARIAKLHNSRQTEYENVKIIEFELCEDANVKLTVCDSEGRITETLIDDLMDSGVYNLNYKSADNIIAGEFTYKLEVKGISGIKNIFAVK